MQRQAAARPTVAPPQRLYGAADLGALAYNARMRQLASLQAMGRFVGMVRFRVELSKGLERPIV